MANQAARFDVIVVGSGAGGASVAYELAQAGAKVLILERGDFLRRSRFNWDARTVFLQREYRTREKWFDKNDKPFNPNTHYWVGGNTTFYGGALFRYRPGDFEEREHHGGGVSPAWPISYQDLAPYYLKAEKLWHVHGARGVDPSEPLDEPEYFFPPLKHDPTIERLKGHLESCGLTPSPLPLGVLRDDEDPIGSTCIRCTTCGGYPCLVRGKADARTIAIDPMLKMSNVYLLPNRKVTKIETDHAGKTVRRVVCDGPNGWEDYSATIVVLAAGAANTAALMLASDNFGHRNGLSNKNDLVGRNYMFHTMSAVVSVSNQKVEADFPKTLCVNDFYWGDPKDGFSYPMGHIQLLERMEGHVLEGQIKEEGYAGDLIPTFLTNAAADRMLAFLCISEDLPDPNNRVRWLANRLRLEYQHGDIEGHNRLVKKLDWALDHFSDGGTKFSRAHLNVTKMLPLYGTAHMCGTTKMGNDPATSVVDVNCKAWELDNLYVTDASVFCSSAAVNPTLTIVANAMRVADHLKERLGLPVERLAPAPPPRMREGFELGPRPTPAPPARLKRKLLPFGR